MSTIAVTGLGLITALGPDVESSFQQIKRGKNGISPVKAWDVSNYETKLAAEIKFPIPTSHINTNTLLDRGHKLLLSVVEQALKDANLLNHTKTLKIGIIIGTSLAGMDSMQRYDKELCYNKKGNLRQLINQPNHFTADIVADTFHLTGPKLVISTACTASTIAIGCSIALLRNGAADMIIAAGCDHLSTISYTGFSCMKNMSTQPAAPYSLPIGLTLGEGAGAIILERLDKTDKKRKMKYAYASNYMFTADGYHATSPDPRGHATSFLLKKLIEKSNITPMDIDYINMHGTGTLGNDATETSIIEKLFYSNGHSIPVSSIKGAVGHTLGAAGIVESVLTIKAMQEDILLPTVNYKTKRQKCTLDYIPNQARKASLKHTIVQNFAFGGNNAAILFSSQKENIQNTNKKRVVVTGMSVISPLGNSFEEIYENIQCGTSAITDYYSEEFKRYFKSAKLDDFNPRNFIKLNTRRMDKLSQLIVSATYLTLKNAKINSNIKNDDPIGLITGTMFGHAQSNLDFHREILTKHPSNIDPIKFPNTVLNAGTGQASIVNRLKGCNIALSMGQGSGLAAIELAYQLIQDGLHSSIIAGGADELFDYLLFNYYYSGLSRSNSTKPVKNMDRLILNEGASYFMLEEHDHAVSRGAHIYAELETCDTTSLEFSVYSKNKNTKDQVEYFLNNFFSKSKTHNEIDKIYTSSLNYKGFIDLESHLLSKLTNNTPPIVDLHNQIGISALTSAVSFGLSCISNDNRSLINSASLGGTYYSALIKKWDH